MTVQTTEEKLQAERDYSIKARLMAEKDLEMALARIEDLEALLRRIRSYTSEYGGAAKALREIRTALGET